MWCWRERKFPSHRAITTLAKRVPRSARLSRQTADPSASPQDDIRGCGRHLWGLAEREFFDLGRSAIFSQNNISAIGAMLRKRANVILSVAKDLQ